MYVNTPLLNSIIEQFCTVIPSVLCRCTMADTFSASEEVLVGTTTLPLQLNSLSEVELDARMARYFLAKMERPVTTSRGETWDGEPARAAHGTAKSVVRDIAIHFYISQYSIPIRYIIQSCSTMRTFTKWTNRERSSVMKRSVQVPTTCATPLMGLRTGSGQRRKSSIILVMWQQLVQFVFMALTLQRLRLILFDWGRL